MSQITYANGTFSFGSPGAPPPWFIQSGASAFSTSATPIPTTTPIANPISHRTITPLEVRDSQENTPLLRAILDGREALARELLTAGANPNHQNIQGQTPLYLSLLSGLTPFIVTLLHHGANPNICTIDGATPLHLASSQGNDTILLTLLQFGAFVNKGDEMGEVPLHWAAREARESTLIQLLAHGADPNITNEDGESPLNLAVVLGELGPAKILLSHGATLSSDDVEAARTNPQLLQLFQAQGTPKCNSSSHPSSATATLSPSSSPLNHRHLTSPSYSKFDDCKPSVVVGSALPHFVTNQS